MLAAKFSPSEVTLSGIFKAVRAVPDNANEPIDVTRFGIPPILASCELAKNRANGISVMFEGSTTDVNSGHAWKACSPIVITESGIVTDVIS
jgi:hypothetical protein